MFEPTAPPPFVIRHSDLVIYKTMPNTSLVLTVLGQDRPGLVESIARVVAEHGGNWIESRMAHVAGHFAGILRVEIGANQSEALTAALRGLAASGLELIIH